MGTYQLLHKATTREIRGGARRALKTIHEVLDDSHTEIRQVDITRENDIQKTMSQPPYSAFDRMSPTGHSTITITLQVFRKPKGKR